MKKSSKGPGKSASPKSGGAFSFKDRTGKVHGTSIPRGPREDDEKRKDEDEPKFSKRPPRGRPKTFGDRAPRGYGPAARPFGEKKFGDRAPRSPKPFGDRPPREGGFKPRSDRGERSFGDRKFGEKKFGDRAPREGGFKPRSDRSERSLGDKKFGDKKFGDRAPREGGFKPRSDRDRGPGGRSGGNSFEARGPRIDLDRSSSRSSSSRGSSESRGPTPFAIVSRKDSRPVHLKATIEKNPKGFAFLIFDKREYEDSFLSPDQAARYFHGDRLEVVISGGGEVLEVNLLQHRYSEIVGKYFRQGKREILYYERKKVREEIPLEGVKDPIPSGHWVRAKLVFEEDPEAYPPFYAEVIEVFGAEIPARADLDMIAAEFGCIEAHSAEAVREAESFTLDLSEADRTDLTETPFITIDGETARDFDDAVYVEKLTAGYRLWVAIADVSHYVKKETALDNEAFGRATSVYFPERAFHMLPRALSENLCSLRPNEKRLTMVCRMDFTFEGRMTATRVINAVIESKRRATYTEIQKEWEESKGSTSFEYQAHFELFKILKRRRHTRGSIDFDLPEAELRVNEEGEPISITQRPRLDAHRLIEEFMIVANEAVTEWAMERNYPFIYRVHEEPAEKNLEKFQELLITSGVDAVIDPEDLTGSIQKLLILIQNHPAQTLLNNALLRSMKQAHYSSLHGGHFGLASEGYTHFTSPIRRYPDLLVHRMLKRIIAEEKDSKKISPMEREELEHMLEDAAEHCSYRERVASEAERESIKLKQARFMLKELGNTFSGKITGMMERGFFTTLDHPYVEGMVSIDNMIDDSYEFREDRMLFVGRRFKKTFQIGQPIQVTVARVDLETRQIDFALPPDQGVDPSKVRHRNKLKASGTPDKI